MANIKILDSGFLNDTKSGTQIVVSNRAGFNGTSGVTSFLLKTSIVSRSRTIALEDKAVVNVKDIHNTSLVSVNNPLISVTAILIKSDDTSGFDVNQLVQFLRLEDTDGLKLLYVDDTTDTNKTLVESLGELNIGGSFGTGASDTGGTVSASTPYLVGRVRNIGVTDNSDGNFWRITFQFELSK